MSRPMTIQNEAILDAARKVFLQHGYQASTARVARVAHVSEGSLFKHFRSKCELFAAAMRAETGIQECEERLMQSVGKGSVRENLEQTARRLLKHLQTVIPRVVMLRSSGVAVSKLRPAEGAPPPVKHMRVVVAYFRKEIELGRLEMESPEMRAHVLVGGLSHYVTCDLLFHYRPGSPSAFIRTLVEAVLADSVRPSKRGRGRRG